MIEVHLMEYRRTIQVDAADTEAALYQVDRDDAIALEPAGQGWDALWWDRHNGLVLRMHARTPLLALAKGFERYKLSADRRGGVHG